MGFSNMAFIRKTGDGIIRNLTSSLEVFCSEISVDFNRHLDTLNIVEGRASRTD